MVEIRTEMHAEVDRLIDSGIDALDAKQIKDAHRLFREAFEKNPEFRCALFADGTQVRLPLPQGAAVMTTDGTVYEVSAVHGLDALGGFATLDLVQQARRAGGA
jgi:hypothetical protein